MIKEKKDQCVLGAGIPGEVDEMCPILRKENRKEITESTVG